jgi:regulator of sigma E protease
MITQVAPNSPAMQAGLLPGDIFISVDDVAIENMDQLVTVINERAGLPVSVKVLRAGQVETFILTPRLEPPPGEGRHGCRLEQPAQAHSLFQIGGLRP